MSNQNTEITWDDLPGYVAIIAALVDGIDQCSIRNLLENREEVHLFLLRDGLLAITEVNLPHDLEPDNRLLLAIARVMVLHRRAAKEGRALV